MKLESADVEDKERIWQLAERFVAQSPTVTPHDPVKLVAHIPRCKQRRRR